MDTINVVSKAKFASARAQRIMLQESDELTAELMCLESGQSLRLHGGRWVYYVIAGEATLRPRNDEDQSPTAPAGRLVAPQPGELHSVVNQAPQRLLCLAVGHR